jgi:hypothetical protein
MRIHGVNRRFIEEVRAAGYSDPSVDDLVNMRIHGIRRQMRQM